MSKRLLCRIIHHDNTIISYCIRAYLKYNIRRQNTRQENKLKSSKIRLLIRPQANNEQKNPIQTEMLIVNLGVDHLFARSETRMTEVADENYPYPFLFPLIDQLLFTFPSYKFSHKLLNFVISYNERRYKKFLNK